MENERISEEKEITARELLEEIAPLLRETFVAKVRLCGDEIALRFANGQCARLTVCFTS